MENEPKPLDDDKKKKKNPFSWRRAGNALMRRRRLQQAMAEELLGEKPMKPRKADALVEGVND